MSKKINKRSLKPNDPKYLTSKTGKKEPTKVPLIKVVYFSLLLTSMSILAVLFFQVYLPPEVPLFYGLPEGPEQLSSSLALIVPSLVSTSFILINVFLVLILESGFLKQTLVITSLAVSLFSSITTLKIILLVGSL